MNQQTLDALLSGLFLFAAAYFLPRGRLTLLVGAVGFIVLAVLLSR
jgi:hypothetical protein